MNPLPSASSDAEDPSFVVNITNSSEAIVAKFINHQEAFLEEEPSYAGRIENCAICKEDLSTHGLLVDCAVRGQAYWGYMCASCFLNSGSKIAWGSGQLFARQPSGNWRLVAGFPPREENQSGKFQCGD
jgi:hypothetical protein